MTAEPYLTYAISPKGKLVHVDSVPNGLLCGCTCPKCNSELVAKMKKVRRLNVLTELLWSIGLEKIREKCPLFNEW